MTPLQKIAMGIVLLAIYARYEVGDAEWDAIPDPLGWLLIVAGVVAVRRADKLPYTGSMLALAVMALVSSVLRYPPQVDQDLDSSALWLLDLLPIGFEILLCFSIAQVLGRRAGRRFFLSGWVLALSPVLAAGALSNDSPELRDAADVSRALAQLLLVWFLFAQGRNPALGGFPRPERSRTEST